MKFILLLITLTFLISLNSFGQTGDPLANSFEKTESVFPNVSDSVRRESLYKNNQIEIELTDSSFHYILKINRNGNVQIIDFDLESIPTKTIELEWVNSDFAAITTWWSAAISRSIFVDLKGNENKYTYFEKDIELTDSTSNNIVYVEGFDAKQIIFHLVNLNTFETLPIKLKIGKRNSIYPYYDKMYIEKHNLFIVSSGRKRKYPLL